MKFISRLILSLILIWVAFWGLNSLLALLFRWISDWNIIWFVFLSAIIFIVLRWLTKFVSVFIAAPVSFADTPIQFNVSKCIIISVSWIIASLNCYIAFYMIDFSETKLFFLAGVVILINCLIPLQTHKQIQEYGATRKAGEQAGDKIIEIADRATKAIQNNESTYEEIIKQLNSWQSQSMITESQTRMIIGIINLKTGKKSF